MYLEKRLIAMLESPNAPDHNFEYGEFVFDTLVLASYPTDVKSVYRFIFATSLLMDLFFARRFPLRGCWEALRPKQEPRKRSVRRRCTSPRSRGRTLVAAPTSYGV